MGLLKSKCRGVIHLLETANGSVPRDAGGLASLPEVEFEGGEGPEQVMDRLQDFAVPLLRKAIEPDGPWLRWEEIDPAAGWLRRHRSALASRLEFELCGDDRGVELLLARDGETRPGRTSRVWVPLGALAAPGRAQRTAVGWSVPRPRLVWRYVLLAQTPTIEITWSCASLYRGWAEQIRRRVRSLECHLAPSSRADSGRQLCRLDPARELRAPRGNKEANRGPLVYRGHVALAKGRALPARWRLSLQQPLVLAEAGEAVHHDLDEDVPVTVEALDFRALLGSRPTRLVSLDDLAQPFAVEVLTAKDVLLPDEIPAGMMRGLPWTMAVGNGNGSGPGVTRGRRWVLSARPRGGGGGYWGQVEWEDYPPVLRFGLGAAEQAPRIARLASRRVSVGWRIAAGDAAGELLATATPHWVPVGHPDRVALPHRGRAHRDSGRHDRGFDREVRARLGGLEERFAIDPGSEVPANRLFLGPRRWRFHDELHGEVTGCEALGEVDGYVRWRRPAKGFSGKETSPTDWAGGSAPVLLVRARRADEDVLHWGGLYAPETVPWEALEEVPGELAADREALILTPRSSVPAIWISLWGFICRYDRRRVLFSQGEAQEVTAWIARRGLELFPRAEEGGRRFLLRSFAPLHAVRDRRARVLSLEPGAPRPTLRLGRGLHSAQGGRVIEVGEGTHVRCQTAAPGETPAAFGPGRVPGTRLYLPAGPPAAGPPAAGPPAAGPPAAGPPAAGPPAAGPPAAGPQVLWFALDAGRQAGYLLSLDPARGWQFRGFFAHPGAMAELGTVRLADRSLRTVLRERSADDRRAFRLTIGANGHEWSASAPERLVRRVTAEMIREWQRRYYARDRLPPPLDGHALRVVRQPIGDGPRIFELVELDDVPELDHPPGIRVWEPHDDAGEDLLGSVRTLGEEAPAGEAVLEARSEPPKKLLRADDDEGF